MNEYYPKVAEAIKGNGFDKVAFAKKDNGTPIDDMHISF